jgi:O-methyltransferase
MDQKQDQPPAWIVHSHGLPPNAVKQREAVDLLHQVFRMPSVFLADRLFTFGRNLTFLKDDPFVKAFLDARPEGVEKGLVWRKHILHWAARRALYLDGDFVEAACYKGFTARVLCNAIDLRAHKKHFWLYDLFEAAPTETPRLEGHSEDLYDRVVARFASDPVTVVRGHLPESLAGNSPERISLLHIDMNNVAAEIGTLTALYDRVVTGGTIVLDDFGWVHNQAQTAAHQAFFGARGDMVLELPTGQGMVIKH